MELYPGAHLIECEISGRPLYLPLLLDGNQAMLLDCGTTHHAAQEVPAYLDRIGCNALTWLVITHPDGDHCGGVAEIKRRYPNVRIACGDADRQLIESPDYLFAYRYDAYRRDHDLFYDEAVAREIRDCFSGGQCVDLTLVGGESIQLTSRRQLEVWHLPGHSHGHIGVYDSRNRTLYYGDAIQGRGYQSLNGDWKLCPTYLYVDDYLETIRVIESSPANMIVGCHWPIWKGGEQIGNFCGESREFVMLAERLVSDYVDAHPGSTLREICLQLSAKLGEWPPETALELANAVSGHLGRLVKGQYLDVDRCNSPLRYYRSAVDRALA